MNLATWLEVVAQALSALLATWLGLTVGTRSGSPVGRAFTVLSLVVATWSSAIILQRMTTAPEVATVARSVEELAAALAIGGLTHFALEIATDGHPTRRQLAAVFLNYAILLAFAAPTIMNRTPPVSVTPPNLSLGPIPGAALGWAWVAARLASIGLAAGWLIAAMRSPNADTLRRRQLTAAMATIVLAGVGASLRFLPVIGDVDRWIGTWFITLAVVSATFAVLAGGIFFGPAVAVRAFRTSITGGVIVVGVIAGLAGLDLLSRTWLGLEAPFFPVLGLIVAAALYGPLAARFGSRLTGGSPRAIARERLLRALGAPALGAQPAEAGVHPALARLARALDVTGLAIVAPDGTLVASEGMPSLPGPIPPIPLLAGGELVGELRVGETASSAPLGARDRRLLDLTAAYVARALQTGRREVEQTSQLASLAEARAQVQSQAVELHAALAERRDLPPGVRVFALGPLRVERDGSRIERWGGDKAGSRQAQALFAFLYDRGERGVAKDEVLELIWPDVELERADLAFHRTMNGLRATLGGDREGGRDVGSRDGGGRDGSSRAAVRFGNDRYRLDGSVVAWSDVDAFLATLNRAAADPLGRVPLLEEARALYRGEYLDDCPYYGDSAFVEERRALLRTRFVDLAVALGEGYEAGGDRMSAAAAFREALSRAPDGCPPAAAGLARLGL